MWAVRQSFGNMVIVWHVTSACATVVCNTGPLDIACIVTLFVTLVTFKQDKDLK